MTELLRGVMYRTLGPRKRLAPMVVLSFGTCPGSERQWACVFSGRDEKHASPGCTLDTTKDQRGGPRDPTMSKDLRADCSRLTADILVLDVLVLVVVIGQISIMSTQNSVVSASGTRAGLQ